MEEQVGISKAHRLDISRENEILQSFVRINLDENDNESGGKPVPRMPVIKIESATPLIEHADRDERQKGAQTSATDHTTGKTGKVGTKTIEKEVSKKGLRKRRRRSHREEEVYTDKDRAAAAAMGSRDIKQSLKIKRKQDRSKDLAIPEEAEPGTFLALGNYEMCRGDLQIALDFMSKALELNPTEKNALVARSKCYLLLGQPENGLKDAETALSIDKNFMKAIYQKAEALYYLGDFEHSLMYYHRGLRLRPDHEGFQLGVHKAQKAIENAIGGSFPLAAGLSETLTTSTRCSTKQSGTSNKTGASSTTPDGATSKSDKTRTTIRSRPPKKSRLLRELGADKEYLDNLLNNPNIKCKYKEDDNTIIDCIKGAVDFLNTRQEFWRQQLPPNLK